MNKNVNLTNTTDFLGEMHDIVDMNNKVIGRAARKKFLQNSKLMRRTVHIWLRNKRGQYWLQKRSSTKDLQPNHWSAAVGGFVKAGAHTHAAIMREAKREMWEELGITVPLKLYRIVPMPRVATGSAMVYWYVGISDGPFKLDPIEVSDLKAFDMSRVWALYKRRKMKLTSLFARELSIYIKNPKKVNNFV